MQIKLTWINTRRRKIISILIDFWISINLYNHIYFNEFDSYPNYLVNISLGFFWITISYILGRYMKEKKISIESIFKSILKVFLLIVLCIIIYVLVNWLSSLIISDQLFLNKNNFLLNNIFVKSIFYIGFVSLFFQYFISIINYRIYEKRNLWIFYGNKEDYMRLSQELKSNAKNSKIKFVSTSENLQTDYSKRLKGIIVNENNLINKDNLDNLYKIKLSGIEVISLINWFEKEFHRVPTNLIENKYQLIMKIKSIEDSFHIRIKRTGDVFVSLLIILLASPIIVIVSLLIYLEDKGPIFYSQIRTGLNGEIIKIIKFRSMHIDAEIEGVQWSNHNDKRITRIGKIIRAVRIDELPQLFCVLSGSMSLIGPRPERPEIEEKLFKEVPYYNSRYVLKPGISGWAQVNYPYGASISDTKIKLSYDIYYLSNFSFFLDLLIFFKTIKLVLNARGYKPQKNTIDKNPSTI